MIPSQLHVHGHSIAIDICNVLHLWCVQVTPLSKDTYVTQIDWLPVIVGGTRKQTSQSELFVLTCTDGKSEVHVYMIVLYNCRKLD